MLDCILKACEVIGAIYCSLQDNIIIEGLSGRFLNAPSRLSLLQNYGNSNTDATLEGSQ